MYINAFVKINQNKINCSHCKKKAIKKGVMKYLVLVLLWIEESADALYLPVLNLSNILLSRVDVTHFST